MIILKSNYKMTITIELVKYFGSRQNAKVKDKDLVEQTNKARVHRMLDPR